MAVNSAVADTISDMDRKLFELPQDCDFSVIWNNSAQRSDCSPILTDPYFSPFQGILINGQKRVIWPAGVSLDDVEVTPDGNTIGPLKLIIAGFLKLPYDTLGLKGDRADSVRIIAVNKTSGEAYVGKMEPMAVPDDLDIPDASAMDGDVDTTEYFNVDLVANLGLPLLNASYTVYATLGEYTSNTVVVLTRVE